MTPVDTFIESLTKMVGNFPGWSVDFVKADHPWGPDVSLRFRCPHGGHSVSSLSVYALDGASPSMFAMEQMVAAMVYCVRGDADKPIKYFMPAGTTVKDKDVTWNMGANNKFSITMKMQLDETAWQILQGSVLSEPAPVLLPPNYSTHTPLKSYINPVIGGKEDTLADGDKLKDMIPGLSSPVPSGCPACLATQGFSVIQLIIHLNDHHKWTRERIADWLDSLEDVDLTIQKAS